MLASFKEADLVKEMTLPLFLVCIYASLGGMGFGMDYNYWSGFLGMEQFKKDFGVYDTTLGAWSIPSTWQSVATGTPTAGLAMGALVSGLIGNRLGRVKTFFVAAVIGGIGILIQCVSFGNYWQLMVGRIVNSVSLGIVCNAIPAYQSECAPVKIRGSLINTYQFFLLVGATFISAANWGLNARTDQWAYRAVLIIQFIVPILLVIGTLVLPESPRWLIGKDKKEDALKVLRLLRRGTPDDLIQQEVELLYLADQEQRQLSEGASWADCFRGTNLRRTGIAIGMQCMQQTQGSSYMSNYSVVFLKSVGVTDVFKIAVLLIFTNTMASAFAFYFPDRFGRRPLILFSALVMAVCMLSIAGVTGYSSTASSNGVLAPLFIWQIFQAVGWSSCVWIVTAEVSTLRLREKTITLATFSGYCVGVLITYISPFIQDAEYGNLQGKIGFIYGGFSVVAIVWAYFVVPELKGRSLEELDELFKSRISTRKFGSTKAFGYGAQLTLAEELAHSGQPGNLVIKGTLSGVEAGTDMDRKATATEKMTEKDSV